MENIVAAVMSEYDKYRIEYSNVVRSLPLSDLVS